MNPVKIPNKFVWTQLIFRFFSEYSNAEQESKLKNQLKTHLCYIRTDDELTNKSFANDPLFINEHLESMFRPSIQK